MPLASENIFLDINSFLTELQIQFRGTRVNYQKTRKARNTYRVGIYMRGRRNMQSRNMSYNYKFTIMFYLCIDNFNFNHREHECRSNDQTFRSNWSFAKFRPGDWGVGWGRLPYKADWNQPRPRAISAIKILRAEMALGTRLGRDVRRLVLGWKFW